MSPHKCPVCKGKACVRCREQSVHIDAEETGVPCVACGATGTVWDVTDEDMVRFSR